MALNFLKHKLGNSYSKQTFEEKRRGEWVNISVENLHVGIPFPDLHQLLCSIKQRGGGIIHYPPRA